MTDATDNPPKRNNTSAPKWQSNILTMTAVALFIILGCALLFIVWTVHVLFTLGEMHADDPLYSWTSIENLRGRD